MPVLAGSAWDTGAASDASTALRMAGTPVRRLMLCARDAKSGDAVGNDFKMRFLIGGITAGL